MKKDFDDENPKRTPKKELNEGEELEFNINPTGNTENSKGFSITEQATNIISSLKDSVFYIWK